jgi:hypothetical protein
MENQGRDDSTAEYPEDDEKLLAIDAGEGDNASLDEKRVRDAQIDSVSHSFTESKTVASESSGWSENASPSGWLVDHAVCAVCDSSLHANQ